MVQKFIDEGKIEAEQEVQLYLLILEKQVRSFYIHIFIHKLRKCALSQCCIFIREKYRRL